MISCESKIKAELQDTNGWTVWVGFINGSTLTIPCNVGQRLLFNTLDDGTNNGSYYKELHVCEIGVTDPTVNIGWDK